MKNQLIAARALAFTAALGFPSIALADSPRHFLEQALEGDNSEVMLGRLAAERARSPRVQDFGRMLVTDHAQARTEVIGVGIRLGVRPSRKVSPEASDERERLNGLEGRDFDREFVRYMIEDHQRDISEFREEADERHGPVSDLAARQLPALQQHLDMAIDLDRNRDRDGRRMDRDGRYQPGQDSPDQERTDRDRIRPDDHR